MKAVLFRAWKRNLIYHLKACEQQEVGTNDCAVFTVRNAHREMGTDVIVTRVWMKLEWRDTKPELSATTEDSVRRKKKWTEVSSSEDCSNVSRRSQISQMK